MKEINKRINYKIVLDTETCPMDKDFQGVDPYNMLAYDISWVVTDRNANVYEIRSFINANVFLDEKELMKSAYYANKIPEYWERIKNGEAILTSFANIRKQLIKDIKMYNIDEVYAHNMRFDLGTLNNTQRWETKSKYRYYFPKDILICDTLKLARQLIAPMKSYKKFCVENGYITKNNQVRLTAEIIYRFLTKDLEFVEEHKGIDDVMIEKEILAYCYRKHKKMNKALYN